MTSASTDAEKLSCLLNLAFNNDRALYDRFCQTVRESVPEAHAAVLRGSAITGTRFVDGAPFDADGPGTSDLDLTLVGADVLRYYSAFWIPGMHSKPLSDDDPDIAPELTPLRQQLTEQHSSRNGSNDQQDGDDDVGVRSEVAQHASPPPSRRW